ncbi:MAG: AAA family ATPase [Clostridia bacterium]|nr:AAA family ATPase [Clostridia bacterium]
MTYIIGIGGGSASGKSTLCDLLEEKFIREGLTVRSLHIDGFFKPEEFRPYVKSHINENMYTDDNCPDTIDWQAFHAKFDEVVSSGEFDIIIVEGILVLWDEYIKSKLNLKIFVDCRADERIIRRIKRNMTWGQSFEQITNVYLDMVRFRHDQYVESTKWTADFIVNGAADTSTVRDMIFKYISK